MYLMSRLVFWPRKFRLSWFRAASRFKQQRRQFPEGHLLLWAVSRWMQSRTGLKMQSRRR